MGKKTRTIKLYPGSPLRDWVKEQMLASKGKAMNILPILGDEVDKQEGLSEEGKKQLKLTLGNGSAADKNRTQIHWVLKYINEGTEALSAAEKLETEMTFMSSFNDQLEARITDISTEIDEIRERDEALIARIEAEREREIARINADYDKKIEAVPLVAKEAELSHCRGQIADCDALIEDKKKERDESFSNGVDLLELADTIRKVVYVIVDGDLTMEKFCKHPGGKLSTTKREAALFPLLEKIAQVEDYNFLRDISLSDIEKVAAEMFPSDKDELVERATQIAVLVAMHNYDNHYYVLELGEEMSKLVLRVLQQMQIPISRL